MIDAKYRSLIFIAVAAGVGVLWWKFRAPAGTVTVEEVDYFPAENPVIAPIVNALESLGVPVRPRGIRNNNPGNIRYDGTTWKGLRGSDGAYCIFDTPENGIRAMNRVLNSYAARGIDTVREIISTWAPPVENNTAAYISAVSSACGVGPDQVPQRLPLLKAIIRHENGQQPYLDSQIIAGMNAA